MEDSQLYQFIERIKSDDALRRRVVDAEETTSRDMDAVRQIASESGYDITAEISRPEKMRLTPTDEELENARCLLTCCWVVTSVWDTEGPSIGGF